MTGIVLPPSHSKQYNQLAREQMKLKLLTDIRSDLMVCGIEGWDKHEYINELKTLINSIDAHEEKHHDQ